MENISAVVAGVLCLDIIPDMEHVAGENLNRMLQPGHLLEIGPARFSAGGVVSNTGCAMNRLGIPTRLVGKMGRDPLAKILRETLAEFDPTLAKGLVEDAGSTTSYSIVLSPPGIDRIFIACSGANDTFGIEDVDFDLVKRARLFHFGYPPFMRRMYADGGRELVDLFRRVKQTGATSSLDMTFPDPVSEGGRVNWRIIFRDLLPSVDIFLPSFGEIMFMLHREEYEQACRSSPCGDVSEILTPRRLSALGAELLEMGVKIAVIKLGERGLYVRTADAAALTQMGRGGPQDVQAWSEQELWSACFAVKVAGTTGSGDATIAGFLTALLRGLGPEDAVNMAVAVGACNVEAADAMSGIRTWDETMARVAGGWEHLPMHLSEPGWVETQPGLWQRK